MAAIPVQTQDIPFPQTQEMGQREKALRDTFVAEYLVDYSVVNAAMRCGFPRTFAQEWGYKFMEEPYVQQKLKQLELTPGDEKTEAEFNKQRIKQQLMREAHYHGPGSSHAARVAALAKLSSIFDMEKPKKTEIDIRHKGGVMAIPSMATSIEGWEAAAAASQDALQNG